MWSLSLSQNILLDGPDLSCDNVRWQPTYMMRWSEMNEVGVVKQRQAALDLRLHQEEDPAMGEPGSPGMTIVRSDVKNRLCQCQGSQVGWSGMA